MDTRQIVDSDGAGFARQIAEVNNVIDDDDDVDDIPEELLAILIPSDAVDGLDTGVLAPEHSMFTIDSVLGHLDTRDCHRRVSRRRIQS